MIDYRVGASQTERLSVSQPVRQTGVISFSLVTASLASCVYLSIRWSSKPQLRFESRRTAFTLTEFLTERICGYRVSRAVLVRIWQMLCQTVRKTSKQLAYIQFAEFSSHPTNCGSETNRTNRPYFT